MSRTIYRVNRGVVDQAMVDEAGSPWWLARHGVDDAGCTRHRVIMACFSDDGLVFVTDQPVPDFETHKVA